MTWVAATAASSSRRRKKYGIRGVGIDLNPDLVAKARENAQQEGVSHLVEFRAQDGLTVDISEATVVTLYMFKWFNNALKPKLQKLKPGSRIVAHDFDIDDWKPSRIEYVKAPDDGSDYAESAPCIFGSSARRWRCRE